MGDGVGGGGGYCLSNQVPGPSIECGSDTFPVSII